VGERGKASSNNPTEIRRPSRLVRHAVSGGVKRLTVQIIATGHCPLGSPRRSSARRPRRRSGVESPGLFLSAEPATRQTPQKGSVLGLTVGANPPHSQGRRRPEPWSVCPPATARALPFLGSPSTSSSETHDVGHHMAHFGGGDHHHHRDHGRGYVRYYGGRGGGGSCWQWSDSADDYVWVCGDHDDN
jgi:hypothetical protein